MERARDPPRNNKNIIYEYSRKECNTFDLYNYVRQNKKNTLAFNFNSMP